MKIIIIIIIIGDKLPQELHSIAHFPKLWPTLLASLPKKKKSHEIESGPNTKVSTHSFESP